MEKVCAQGRDACPRRRWPMLPMTVKRIMPTWKSTARTIISSTILSTRRPIVTETSTLCANTSSVRITTSNTVNKTTSSSVQPNFSYHSSTSASTRRPMAMPLCGRNLPGRPIKSQCTQAKGNRQIQVSFQFREFRRLVKILLQKEDNNCEPNALWMSKPPSET